MNVPGWLPPALASEGVHVLPAFSRWPETGEQDFGGWFLLDERGAIANRTELGQLYPGRKLLPFARRCDSDDVACLISNDPEHLRGTDLLIHDGAMRGCEVEGAVDTLAQWFEQAREEAGHGKPWRRAP